MSEFKIDKNVAIPLNPGGAGRSSIFPWDEMEVGDSFFIPGKSTRHVALGKRRRKNGYRICCRTVTEGKGRGAKKGVRVWRIA